MSKLKTVARWIRSAYEDLLECYEDDGQPTSEQNTKVDERVSQIVHLSGCQGDEQLWLTLHFGLIREISNNGKLNLEEVVGLIDDIETKLRSLNLAH
jgi:hypothetical protein